MTASKNWDALEKIEYALWSEENPGAGLKDFQKHLDRLNGKEPQPLTIDVLDRDETRRLRRLYGSKLETALK